MRIGLGYDVHKLVEGRPLILGGVEIPFEKGLLGHSDADVLLHAVCDAVLGAVGRGDIGRHFPDTDEKYRGISSLKLLEAVAQMAAQDGFRCENIDAVIVAQRPRLAAHMQAMQANIARCLQTAPGAVNVKATTTEGLGPEGREEGISAQAVVLMAETGL